MGRPAPRTAVGVACATVAAAGSAEDADSAYQRGDFALAARLFRPFAEQGIAQAQFNLGVMYHGGQGVLQDFVRSYMWFNAAAVAVSGDDGKTVMKHRDSVVSRMTAAQIGKAQEMARCCQETKFKECG